MDGNDGVSTIQGLHQFAEQDVSDLFQYAPSQPVFESEAGNIRETFGDIPGNAAHATNLFADIPSDSDEDHDNPPASPAHLIQDFARDRQVLTVSRSHRQHQLARGGSSALMRFAARNRQPAGETMATSPSRRAMRAALTMEKSPLEGSVVEEQSVENVGSWHQGTRGNSHGSIRGDINAMRDATRTQSAISNSANTPGSKTARVHELLQHLGNNSVDSATNAIISAFFAFDRHGSVLITTGDGIFDNFRSLQMTEADKENSSATTPMSGKQRPTIKDKRHILHDVRSVLLKRRLQALSKLQENQIPEDFEQDLPNTENILGKRVRGSPNAPREWKGVVLRYGVNPQTQMLIIPHTSYDEPGCPAELKKLRELFPDVMNYRPCDSCISVQEAHQHSPGSGSGTNSAGMHSHSGAPPVAVILPIPHPENDRTALILEVRPTIYREDMDMRVGWDCDRDLLAITFIYKDHVIATRASHLGGDNITFEKVFKDHMGNGWGEPEQTQDDGCFFATHRADIVSLLQAGGREELYIRAPVSGHPARQIIHIPEEHLFVIRLNIYQPHARTGIVYADD